MTKIIKTGRTQSMAGDTLVDMFLTFDGRWYRVTTRLVRMGRYKSKERAEARFAQCEAKTAEVMQ